MKKSVKYAIGIIVVAVAGYNSLYFKKLSDVKQGADKFNAPQYASELYSKILSDSAKAIPLDQLVKDIQTDKEKAFATYGNALAIGSTRYFLVKGNGGVKDVQESDVPIETSEKNEVNIATEFVYGNAIRDASKKVSLNDFSNTEDLNNISVEVNKLIRTKILPPFKSAVKKGATVIFLGAVELNKEHLNLNDMELIPIQLSPQ